MSVPAVITLSREVIDAARFVMARETPAAKSDRPVFAPARRDTAWMDDFAALRQAPQAQAASAGHVATAASGGDIADPAAAGPAATADLSTTLGSLSPVDSAVASVAAPAAPIATAALPGPVFAAPKPSVAPVPLPAPAIASAAPPAAAAKAHGPASRQATLVLPPVPDPDANLATRLVEGRRPIVVVTIPPRAETPEAEPAAGTAAAAPVAVVLPVPAALPPTPSASTPAPAPAPRVVAAAPAVLPPPIVTTPEAAAVPTETADASLVTGSIAPAAPAEAPSARAAIFGSFAPAPWLRFGAPSSDRPAPAPMAASPVERPAVIAAVARTPAPKPILARTVAIGAAGQGGGGTGQAATQGSELAYAPAAPVTAPFDAVLGGPRQTPRADLPKLPAHMHDWAYGELPASTSDAKQKKCLAEGIYFESRGESERGQAAVAQVILNRVKNPAYPDSICDVVYQNRTWFNRCQFSFACDGIRDAVREPEAWKTAQRVAEDVVSGKTYLPEVGDSTHYHATWVRPGWRREMTRLTRIGVHVFYRTVNGGWN